MRNRGMLIFEILLSLAVLWFVLESFGYNERARLLPLVIGVPTLVLMIIQTALDNIPGLAKYRSGSLKLVNVEQAKKQVKDDQPDVKEIGRREISALTWVIGLGIALSLFGYYIVIPVFLVLFLRLVGKTSWRAVGLSTVITCLLLYGAFVYILDINFYSGMLFGR